MLTNEQLDALTDRPRRIDHEKVVAAIRAAIAKKFTPGARVADLTDGGEAVVSGFNTRTAGIYTGDEFPIVLTRNGAELHRKLDQLRLVEVAP